MQSLILTWKTTQAMIKEINGWFYIVNLGAFHGFPFPTRADAEEALMALTKEPDQ